MTEGKQATSTSLVDKEIEQFRKQSDNTNFTVTTVNCTLTGQIEEEYDEQPDSVEAVYETSPNDNSENDDICGHCRKGQGKRSARWVQCGKCSVWFHISCVGVNVRQYDAIGDIEWLCRNCKHDGQMETNKLCWGEYGDEVSLRTMINQIFSEIVTWDKNIMLLPRGKAGKDFLVELTRLLSLFNHKTIWEAVALSLVQIFIPLMLQKPSSRSKARENSQYLSARLEKWSRGDITGILMECKEIQKRLKKFNSARETNRRKLFCQRMLQGKVSQATRLIDNANRTGLLPINEDTIEKLREKHPKVTKRSGPELHPSTQIQPVIFESIDGPAIQDAAKNTFGSGGPTLIDADGWKHLLCSKSYGKASETLAQSIADTAKRISTESIDPKALTEILASRLIPLDKCPGVRPIGIGEVLRRIMGKAVIKVIKRDIMEASGTLQTCSGVDSGLEATVHAMAEKFAEDSTQGIMIVDATNAFNSIHREIALDTVAVHCPVFHQFLKNTYQMKTKLYISGSKEGEFIWGEEGHTQGDVAAMQFYAIATRPIIDDLLAYSDAVMAWYADDSSACGTLIELLKWWNRLCIIGPKYGYYPNASKTILIIKNAEDLKEAEELFRPLGMNVTCAGERHLGAVVGSSNFKESYIKNKVEKWAQDIDELAEIAIDEPQLAYAAFTKGICHRWTYYMRTIPNISELLLPLEKKIAEVFIPAVLGRPVSQHEREILELPVRYGGMGLINPVRVSQREYRCSKEITEPLVKLISHQNMDLYNLDMGEVNERKHRLTKEKDEYLKQRFDLLYNLSDQRLKNHLNQASEKGASSWLTALPLKSLNYVLNKQEFQDSVRLRYGWQIIGMPKYCACGKKNSVYHTLDCKQGGYVSMRHNAMRDNAAYFLREAKCKDVRTEPALIPVNPANFSRHTNTQEEARLDVSAVGLYAPFERTFFDVRVTHPNCDTNTYKPLDKIYKEHEKAKKNMYEERVLESEKGSFIPLIFTTSGGMGPLCTIFVKRLSSLIAEDKKEARSQVTNHIRTRLRFAMLRSTLIALRGVRGKSRPQYGSLDEVSFNLIPEKRCYEIP